MLVLLILTDANFYPGAFWHQQMPKIKAKFPIYDKNGVENLFDTNITLENFLKICEKFGPLFPYSPCLSEKLEVSS